MTPTEFLHQFSGSQRDYCIAALYYAKRFDDIDALGVGEVKKRLTAAKVPKASGFNVANILARAVPLAEVVATTKDGALWRVTATGEKHIRDVLGLPDQDAEIVHDVAMLEALANALKDDDVKRYVSEAVICLRFGALRAAIVFLWAGAVRIIQEWVMAADTDDMNAAVQKYDPDVGEVKKIDDLSYLKETKLLLVALELRIVDKNERGILQESLDLRNKCGHPGKYFPGAKKASSFIEDVVGIVYKNVT